MAYLNLHIRDWLKNNDGLEDLYLPLNVIRDKGFEVEPEVNIKITDLNKSTLDNRAYKFFLNNGDGGITFKIQVIIHRNNTWKITVKDEAGKVILKNPRVTNALKKIYAEMLICSIQTDAIDIPNGLYIITKNKKRTQDYENYTGWELEFTTFYPLQSYRYSNTNKKVLEAINSANAKRKAEVEAQMYPNRATQDKLKKCDWTKLYYTPTKRVTDCCKYVQTILKQQKCFSDTVDGWWGSYTREGIKAFQKKYASKYGLKATGVMDKKTFDALCVVQ